MSIETIFGNLQGLKSSQLKQLQRLYHQRIPGDRITTPEFAQRLAAISTDIKQPVCAYLNRRGQVMRVGVGTPRQTQIPLLELPRYGAERLSGIRCISTHMKSEPPSEGVLTSMALQRLDTLVVLNITGAGFTRRGGGATGYVKEAYLAHLTPQDTRALIASSNLQSGASPVPHPSWSISPAMSLDALGKQDFIDLVEGLEEEFSREFIAQEVDSDRDRVVIVGVMTERIGTHTFQDTLAELARLVDTAGGDVLQTLWQKRSRIHPKP